MRWGRDEKRRRAGGKRREVGGGRSRGKKGVG